MNRIAVVLFQNMRYAPFLRFYLNILDTIPSFSYDVIYFDRDQSLNEKENEHYIKIDWKGHGTLSASPLERIFNFIRYKFLLKKIIRDKKYDCLIILTTFPAVLISCFLSKKYRHRYIVDIRDYTHESSKLYFYYEKQALKNAAIRIISSPGFVNFLPQDDYLLCHNINQDAIVSDSVFEPAKGRRIVISYIGTINYKNNCKKLIDLVIADPRFEFHFYGNEADGNDVFEYVKYKNNDRVKMMGDFLPQDKRDIYQISDLVFNCYGNDSSLVKYAISNKFYDGAFFKKPLLVSPNTALANFSKDFAFPLDLDNTSSLDGLYAWYTSIDLEAYTVFSNTIIERANKDNDGIKKAIISFLSQFSNT